MARKDALGQDDQLEVPGTPERDFKAELTSQLNAVIARVEDAQRELNLARREERQIRAALGRLR